MLTKPGVSSHQTCHVPLPRSPLTLVLLAEDLREVDLLLDGLVPSDGLEAEAWLAVLGDGGQLEEVSRADELHSAEGLHWILAHHLPDLVELVKQFGVHHGDWGQHGMGWIVLVVGTTWAMKQLLTLIDDQHFRAGPASGSLLVTLDLRDQLGRLLGGEAHTPERVQRDATDVAGGDTSRGGDSDGVRRSGVLELQRLDDLAKQNRLASA
jgi:hypothetical protein